MWICKVLLSLCGQAIKASGLANAWAKMVVAAGHHVAMGHPIGVLMALSFITSLLSNLMSHTATAALMAPIAMKVCAAESMKLVLLGPTCPTWLFFFKKNTCCNITGKPLLLPAPSSTTCPNIKKHCVLWDKMHMSRRIAFILQRTA